MAQYTEAAEEQLHDHIPVLTEMAGKCIINAENGVNHTLIEGDNLHALTILSKTHKAGVNVIYIDPPYNTGKSNFTYRDVFKDRQARFHNYSFNHNTWLSFMYRRLVHAKQLLSSRGIFLSA